MVGRAVLIFLAGAAFLQADPAADKLTAKGIAEFSAAYRTWDGARFVEAADYFRQASDKDPASATKACWLGTALFHRMLQLKSVSEPNSAAAAMDGAVAALETAVRLDPANAEAHAMLGTILGMRIDGNPIGAIRHGPALMKHQELALKHGPANPRVRYLLGAGKLHTARDDAKRREALGTLLEAEKLFKAEAAKPARAFEPRWGHSACLTFIARTHEGLGENHDAATYYKAALALHPADQVAREGLKRVKAKQPASHE